MTRLLTKPASSAASPHAGRSIKAPGSLCAYTADSRLPAPGSRLPAPGSRLPDPPSPVSRLPSPVSRLPAPGSRLPSPISRLPSPVSRLPSPVSRLPAPGSRLPAPGFRLSVPFPGSHLSSSRYRHSEFRLPAPNQISEISIWVNFWSNPTSHSTGKIILLKLDMSKIT